MIKQIKSLFREKAGEFEKWLEKGILSDKDLDYQIVLGPVKSARFGNVLEVNNVNKKICSYNCVYCPLGKTNCCSSAQCCYLSPYELHFLVRHKLETIRKNGEEIEYIVFAGSGEPTLDSGLSKEILLLRDLGYKIAVLTNASLLWNENVQENLMFADCVSIKIDTANEEVWSKISKPHPRLNYELILDGIKSFAKNYHGIVTSETTIVKNMNDTREEMLGLAEFLNPMKLNSSYFVKPKYPPGSCCQVIPDEDILNYLSGIITGNINKSIILFDSKVEEVTFTRDFENELLGMLAVQPVELDAVEKSIKQINCIEKLKGMIKNKKIKVMEYNGSSILINNLPAA